ncbi:MAG TPA: hypothetical protein VFO19_13050 [Vicinamibacterales bacterium]|nr:hypothetical protein [Vicinamibacterales bacterium]
MHNVLIALVLMQAGQGAPAPAPSAPQSQPAPCPVSADAEFGRVPAKPIRVGGAGVYLASRQRRYFESVRGPGGETVTATRRGSAPNAGGERGMVDVYEVTYEGLEKPLTLYVDSYHYESIAAPQGFQCVEDRLGPPPVDALLAMEMGERLAIAVGSEKDLPGISLDADGSSTHGVVYDRFLLMARSARAAAAAGTPLQPDQRPARSAQLGMVLVAYPQTCTDRAVIPVSIEVGSAQGGVKPTGGSVTGDALTKLVPGLTAATGSIGQAFALAGLRQGDAVRITYSGALCGGTETSVILPVKVTGMRGVNMPQPPLPAGFTAPISPVWLQVVVDQEGRLREATYVGGPKELVEAAIAALRDWRADPARVNGTPITADSLVVITFK